MRTTLTIDDDLAGILQKTASQQGHSFKEVVNDALRAGLTVGGGQVAIKRKPFKVTARPLRLKPGLDADRMNQLLDELDVEDYLRKTAKDDSAGR